MDASSKNMVSRKTRLKFCIQFTQKKFYSPLISQTRTIKGTFLLLKQVLFSYSFLPTIDSGLFSEVTRASLRTTDANIVPRIHIHLRLLSNSCSHFCHYFQNWQKSFIKYNYCQKSSDFNNLWPRMNMFRSKSPRNFKTQTTTNARSEKTLFHFCNFCKSYTRQLLKKQ